MSLNQDILDRIDAAIRTDVNLLVACVHRYDAEPEKGKGDRYGWHLLIPREGEHGYLFDNRVLGMVEQGDNARLVLSLVLKRGMDVLEYMDRIPLVSIRPEDNLLDFMIDQVAPLEFQRPMHDGDPRYLSRLTVFTTNKGKRGKWATKT